MFCAREFFRTAPEFPKTGLVISLNIRAVEVLHLNADASSLTFEDCTRCQCSSVRMRSLRSGPSLPSSKSSASCARRNSPPEQASGMLQR
jgi:hypothetical protein